MSIWQYLKFTACMSCFHACRGIVNVFTTIGSVAVATATPIATAMEPDVRDRIESAYQNKKQEWN